MYSCESTLIDDNGGIEMISTLPKDDLFCNDEMLFKHHTYCNVNGKFCKIWFNCWNILFRASFKGSGSVESGGYNVAQCDVPLMKCE